MSNVGKITYRRNKVGGRWHEVARDTGFDRSFEEITSKSEVAFFRSPGGTEGTKQNKHESVSPDGLHMTVWYRDARQFPKIPVKE